MADVIMLSKVRCSFPHLVEPHSASSAPDAKKAFQCDLILAPDHKGWKEIMERVAELAKDTWAEHGSQILNMINNDRRLRFYGQGAERIRKDTMTPYEGYEGNYFISAKRDTRPQMIKANGQAADPENTMECTALARAIYGGCYVNAAIRPWPQDNKHGRGMRCELVAIQFAADGEPFGAGVTDASSMFGAVAQVSGPSNAGAPVPEQSNPFGQPSSQPAPGMPAPPFGTPGKPDWM